MRPYLSDIPRTMPAFSAAGEDVSLQLASPETFRVLFILSASCGYCKENLPQWQSILEAMERSIGVDKNALVISVSPTDETSAFLRAGSLNVDDVRLTEPWAITAFGVRGVPATVLIRPGEERVEVWSGVLSAEDVQEIIQAFPAAPGD